MKLLEKGSSTFAQIDTDGLGNNSVFRNLTTLSNVSLAALNIDTDFVV